MGSKTMHTHGTTTKMQQTANNCGLDITVLSPLHLFSYGLSQGFQMLRMYSQSRTTGQLFTNELERMWKEFVVT
jgi:hypothetical protein